MATKTDIELKIVDSVDTSHSDAEVLADSASNPDAFYVGRGYLAHNGEKVIEGIDTDGTYPNVTVGNATKATTADTANRANTAATAATAVNVYEAPVLSATEDEQITVKVGNKTSNALTVPYAQRADFATDLSGRVEATPEVFTYRPSAGDTSIKDSSAVIRRIKGNSVVWNQQINNQIDQTGNNGWWVRQGASNGVINDDGSITINWNSGTSAMPQISQNIGFIGGHKYFTYVEFEYPERFWNGNNAFVKCRQSSDLYGNISTDFANSYESYSNKGIIKSIHTAVSDKPMLLIVFIDLPDGFNDLGYSSTFKVSVFDLTLMFGTGNEPTTVEEFRALYPDSYYPYNAGEIRNLNCSCIKTVGFNQWDEQWERGTLSATGQPDNTSTTIRSKNYIPVISDTDYYVGITSDGFDDIYYIAVSWYDSNKNFISRTYCNRKVVKSPTNAAFLKFGTNINTYIYGNTYHNDICINLSHTGYRNGEYEPYKEVTHALPLNKITNGEPLRKAGSVYDEINETEYIRRVGVVDLGSFNFVAEQNNIFTCYNVPNMIITTDNSVRLDGLFCSKYTIDTKLDVGPAMTDKTMKRHRGNLYIRDTSFTDVPSFKAALSGVLLHYELAEPIYTPIETPIDFNYYVEDFGTEEALLTEDSAPFSADIVYQFNATDNIRQNRISIQKLNNIFSGSGGEYVRADGSWGYIADLKGNFFAKPTLKRIRTGISELSDTIQIIHPYLTEHAGDAEIVLMAVKRRGGTYYNKNTNAKGRRKKRKAWGELHYAAMPEAEINHNTIVMPNGASFEAWQSVILTACGRIPEGLENAREPYNVNVASEDLAEFFAANGAIFVGKTPAIRLGIALRIPNPNFIDYGNGKKMWDYNDVTGKWEYKYLYSDVAEVVVKSQMLRTGGYVLGLELV